MTIQDVLRSIFVYTMAFVMLSMLLLTMPLILDTHQSMSVSTRNGAISYLNGIGYVVLAQAGTPLAEDLYTRNVYPGSGSTFDVGANGNEYAEGWYDKLYVGGSEAVRTATVVVAAVNSSAAAIAQSDFQCDGVADDVQIQAAIDVVAAAGGGIVWLAAGDYTLAASVIHDGTPLTILGAGMYATQLTLANGVDADMFHIADTTAVNGFRMAYMGLNGNKANNAAGDGLFMNKVDHALIEHVRFNSFKEDGISGSGDSYADITISDCVSENNDDNGIDFNIFEWARVFGGTYQNNGNKGIEFSKSMATARAIVMGAMVVNNGGIGIGFNSQLMAIATGNFLDGNGAVGIQGWECDYFEATDNQIDGGSVNGIDSASSNYALIANNIVKDISGGGEQKGILVYNGVSARVTGNIVSNNGHAGIQVTDTPDVSINDNHSFNNGILGVNKWQQAGITVRALNENLDDIEIIGNKSFNATTGNQTYGITLFAEAGRTIDSVRIANNNLGNNTGAPYTTGGPGTVSNVIIQFNDGYVTENWGSATGTGAEQTIAHDLAAAPTYVNGWGNATDANVFQSTVADATNIYLTADNGEGYRWEVKVR